MNESSASPTEVLIAKTICRVVKDRSPGHDSSTMFLIPTDADLEETAKRCGVSLGMVKNVNIWGKAHVWWDS